jgi:hypothetical protein
MAEQQKPDTNVKWPRHRSPAYPAISLRKALERSKDFYAIQKQHAAPTTATVGIWGFGSKSSGGLQTISALKQYGLMNESGEGDSRQLQLTDAALAILRDERRPSPDRDAGIRKAALLPKIHAEMWKKWGAQLPADATVKYFLNHEKEYNEAAVADLIASYKDTISFAKLAETDKNAPVEGRPGEKGDGEGEPLPPPLSPRKGAKLMDGERELTTGLLSKTASFRLIVSGDVGVKEIERLIAKLELDKEILAETDDSDARDNETSE